MAYDDELTRYDDHYLNMMLRHNGGTAGLCLHPAVVRDDRAYELEGSSGIAGSSLMRERGAHNSVETPQLVKAGRRAAWHSQRHATCTGGRRAPRHTVKHCLVRAQVCQSLAAPSPLLCAPPLCFVYTHNHLAPTRHARVHTPRRGGGQLTSAPVIFSTYFVTAASVSFGSVTRSHPTTAHSSARASSYLQAKKHGHPRGLGRVLSQHSSTVLKRVLEWRTDGRQQTSQRRSRC